MSRSGWVRDTLIAAGYSVEDADRAMAEVKAEHFDKAAQLADGLRQFKQASGARWSAQVSENVGILRVADQLRAEAQALATAAAPVPVKTAGDETGEARALRKERDRYRSAWQSARFRAQAYGEGILQVVKDRESYQGWLRQAEARIVELERPSIEARRNEIRSTYTELSSQAEQDRDHEGAAVVQQQLREREAVWAREDELAKEFETDPLAKRPFGSEATS